jgi:hypothetical protein
MGRDCTCHSPCAHASARILGRIRASLDLPKIYNTKRRRLISYSGSRRNNSQPPRRWWDCWPNWVRHPAPEQVARFAIDRWTVSHYFALIIPPPSGASGAYQTSRWCSVVWRGVWRSTGFVMMRLDFELLITAKCLDWPTLLTDSRSEIVIRSLSIHQR